MSPGLGVRPMGDLLQPLDAGSGGRLRLFCFPFAGGATSAFRGWAPNLPPAVELWGIQLPGRENRLGEPPFERIDEALRALEREIVTHLDRPYAFFGHSMGALLCWELARSLQSLGAPAPSHVFVSGREAPHAAEPCSDSLHQSSDERLIEELREQGGTDPQILANAEMLALVLPPFRADLAIIETYRYESGSLLGCPVTAFGGVDDRSVSVDGLEAWAELTTGPAEVQMFPGGHFFVTSMRDAVTASVTRRLGPYLRAMGGK